ncbi:MAG: tetratricopeptide repeat protein [Pseudomonadota bacterium]
MSDSEIFREVEEALKEDRAKALWKKYGTLVVAAAVVVILAVGGYVLWQNYSRAQVERGGAELIAALSIAQEDESAGIEALSSYAQETGGDLAAMARLNSAALMANSGDLEGAVAGYRAVASDSNISAIWTDLAVYLAVLHSIDTANPAELADELLPLTAADNPWRHSARELTALLAIRQGDNAEALQIYEDLRDDNTVPPGLRDRASSMAALLAE